jgi:3-(3-hydroxy-phenyl)propionate hydroxylase
VAGAEVACEVLVVGAGPVGMTAAILLAARGVRVLVVERNTGTADDPKAISLDDESLRTYQQAGIADQVLRVIVPGTGTMYFDSDDQELFHARAAVPFRSGFPFKNPFAQPDLERVLSAALSSHPLIDLRFGATLKSFTQDADGVDAEIQWAGGTVAARSRFIIGADGGRSTVRSIVATPMIGRSHNDVWLVIDTLGDTRTERYSMHHANPRRPHVVVPGLGGRCRYEFYTYPGECEATDDPPFELIERLLAPYRSITPEQVERAVAYKFHGLNAERWQHGRAFLMGDAAHMMPPFAGQGLNSGVRDAANLTWKLTEVLQERATANILGTYEIERRPQVEAVVRSSERLGRVVMTRSVRLARYRDNAVRRVLDTPDGRSFFEEMRWRPSARYESGLLFAPESSPLVGAQIGQPTVFWFNRHEQVPFDRILGNGWALLGVEVTDDDWRRAATALQPLEPQLVDVPLDDTVHNRPEQIQIAIDLDTRLYAELADARGHFVLIRPDRFVAAVIAPTQIDDLVTGLVSPLTVASSLASLHG